MAVEEEVEDEAVPGSEVAMREEQTGAEERKRRLMEEWEEDFDVA